MTLSAQSDRETYRVIVLGRDGSELLLAHTEAGLRFPDVMTPRCGRVAEHLTIAMNREWGEDVICLFELGAEDVLGAEGDVRYQVTNHWRSVRTSAVPTQWVSLDDLREVSFVDLSDYSALQTSLAQCRAAVCDPNTSPFARLGWFQDLCSWAGEILASRGLHLNGNFRQLNASSCFSLVRLETNGPAVWFKAVGVPNKRELPVTLTLARLLPEHIPEILAIQADWNGWLMSEAAGTNLGETTATSLWQTAAAAAANLQIESIASNGQLLRSGAHDLRSKTLADAVAPFMTVVAELMRQQPNAPPPVLSEMELDLLAERVQDAISRLRELGIPDTLGHLDLNPGNIIVSPKECVFLDWAEAYVGHPFFSLQYLLEHFRRIVAKGPASEAELTASYLAPWEQIASAEFLNEAMALAPLLAVFAYAAGADVWRQPESLKDPKLAGYFRALARRMDREANQLSNRRVPCLS